MSLILQCVYSGLCEAGFDAWLHESGRLFVTVALDNQDHVQVIRDQLKYTQEMWFSRGIKIPCVALSVLCSDPECVDRVVAYAVARRDAGYPVEDVE